MNAILDAEHAGESSGSGQLKLFRQLLEHFPETIYCAHCTPKREVVFVSGGVEALTGYPPTHFLGSSAASLQDFIHPDDRAKASDIINQAVAQKRSNRKSVV